MQGYGRCATNVCVSTSTSASAGPRPNQSNRSSSGPITWSNSQLGSAVAAFAADDAGNDRVVTFLQEPEARAVGLGPMLPGLAVVGLHSDGVATGGMMPEHTGTEVVVLGSPLNHCTYVDVAQIYISSSVRTGDLLQLT